MVRTIEADDDRRFDADAFVEWAQEQTDKSRSMTSRIIVNDDDMVKFRLREERDGIEDITLIREREVDVIRFTNDHNHEMRQFASHKRDVTFHDKTLIVRTKDGDEICRAGTGTPGKKGPFPV